MPRLFCSPSILALPMLVLSKKASKYRTQSCLRSDRSSDRGDETYPGDQPQVKSSQQLLILELMVNRVTNSTVLGRLTMTLRPDLDVTGSGSGGRVDAIDVMDCMRSSDVSVFPLLPLARDSILYDSVMFVVQASGVAKRR